LKLLKLERMVEVTCLSLWPLKHGAASRRRRSLAASIYSSFPLFAALTGKPR